MNLGNEQVPKAFLVIGGSKVYSFSKRTVTMGRALDNDLIFFLF